MKMHRLSPLAASALIAVAGGIGLAAPATAGAQGLGAQRAEEALSALSTRYTQLWTVMPTAHRASFARAERHWLHVTRWEERDRCLANRAPQAVAAERANVAAHCLAEVTLRRLRALPAATVAAR